MRPLSFSWRLGGLAAPLLVVAAALSCNGTTGDTLLTFSAYASGVPGASKPFQTANNFTIQLTAAKMLIGAVYFDESPPTTGFDTPVCISPGVYAAQVPGPVEVDLLSTTPQPFSVPGNGTADVAQSWQVWLTDGDINTVNFTPIVQVEGVATDAKGNSVSFGAVVTINAVNRSKGSPDPTQPGLDPLCQLRIVQIPTDVQFFPGGALYVTVDPRVWFTELDLPIDFSPGQLPLITDPNCNPDFDVVTDPNNYALDAEAPPPASQTCGGSGQPCCTDDAGAPMAQPCLGVLTCTENVCGPTYCIPNSSLLSGSIGTTGADFFDEVASGAAFSFSYTQQQP